MDRRAFIAMVGCGILTASIAVQAQQPAKPHHIGFLSAGQSPAHRQQLEALREGLRKLGYEEGRTIVITALWPKASSELPELAAALVNRNVELIVAPATPAVMALKRVTETVPIVFALAADPVGSGLVASLARPGGNITGLSQLNIELSGKRLELLHEAAPFRRAVVLWFADDTDPAIDTLTAILRETERRGRALGVDLRLVKVARVEELAAAVGGLQRRQDGGLVVLPTPLAFAHASTVAELALKQRLPAVSFGRDFADRGGLLAYGVDYDDQMRRAATYVDRILKGSPPGELPVQQASKFQLFVNLKTARALGLTIPPSVLGLAEQIIE